MTEKKEITPFLSKKESSQAHERLAADLHDGVSQELVAILWKLEELRHGKQNEDMSGELDELSDHLREVINDLQNIIYGIRPVLIDQMGFIDGVYNWANKRLAEHDIQLDFDSSPNLQVLPRFVTGQVFRILQEGINNICNHACAKHVTLSIKQEGSNLVIILKDDGRGFNQVQATGLGLQLIRERAMLIHSEVQINSKIGEGTTLQLIIPNKGGD